MPRRGIPRRGAFKNRAEGIVDMEAIYSSADLAFLDSSLKELQQRVQSLLRKNSAPLQRQGLANLLDEVQQAGRALAAGEGQDGFAVKDLEIFYYAVHAQRRRVDQFLDTAVCPADKRNDLVSAASAVNALLRKLRADLEAKGGSVSAAVKRGASGA